jgi:hypothetical protein
MWTPLCPLGRRSGRPERGRSRSDRRSIAAHRARIQVETLEGRALCSVRGDLPVPSPSAHHPVAAQIVATEVNHPATHSSAVMALKINSAKKPSFSVAQINRLLPGKWHVDYDASSLFGPGARGVQEITFTGPKGVHSFVSTTGVVVQGFFGPAYYQFSSWGTYRMITKNLLRLTITGASPTEYLNNRIIVMGGQSMPIQFQNNNQFVVQGQVYHRIPLNSGVF